MTVKKKKRVRGELSEEGRSRLNARWMRERRERREAYKRQLNVDATFNLRVGDRAIAGVDVNAYCATPSASTYRDLAPALEQALPALVGLLTGGAVSVSPPGEHHEKCPNNPKRRDSVKTGDAAGPVAGSIGDPDFCDVSKRIDTGEVGVNAYTAYTAPELLYPCLLLARHDSDHAFGSWGARQDPDLLRATFREHAERARGKKAD